MSASAIELIAGLGNPGERYAPTRHNAGFWLLDALAERAGASFRHEGRLQGALADARLPGSRVRLLKPATYMNLSGQSLGAAARYFKVPTESILVVHAELDLPPGAARLKHGGGHGGHNGLRDIAAHLDAGFWRLRLGIGRPSPGADVVAYVLTRPPPAEEQAIRQAMDDALAAIECLLREGPQRAMHELHSRR